MQQCYYLNLPDGGRYLSACLKGCTGDAQGLNSTHVAGSGCFGAGQPAQQVGRPGGLLDDRCRGAAGDAGHVRCAARGVRVRLHIRSNRRVTQHQTDSRLHTLDPRASACLRATPSVPARLKRAARWVLLDGDVSAGCGVQCNYGRAGAGACLSYTQTGSIRIRQVQPTALLNWTGCVTSTMLPADDLRPLSTPAHHSQV